MMATADELFTERASIMVGEKKSGTTNWPSAHRHSRPGGKVTRKQMAAIDENRTVLHTVHCILKKKTNGENGRRGTAERFAFGRQKKGTPESRKALEEATAKSGRIAIKIGRSLRRERERERALTYSLCDVSPRDRRCKEAR